MAESEESCASDGQELVRKAASTCKMLVLGYNSAYSLSTWQVRFDRNRDIYISYMVRGPVSVRLAGLSVVRILVQFRSHFTFLRI